MSVEKRNVVKDPAPNMVGHLSGIRKSDGKVKGYPSTYYLECESLDIDAEGFVRVVMYGDESKDFETRIPFAMLKAVGITRIPKGH